MKLQYKRLDIKKASFYVKMTIYGYKKRWKECVTLQTVTVYCALTVFVYNRKTWPCLNIYGVPYNCFRLQIFKQTSICVIRSLFYSCSLAQIMNLQLWTMCHNQPTIAVDENVLESKIKRNPELNQRFIKLSLVM